MPKQHLTYTTLACCLVASRLAYAQATPAGLWQSIDDATGKSRAEIRITEASGVFTGRIVRSLQPTAAGAWLYRASFRNQIWLRVAS